MLKNILKVEGVQLLNKKEQMTLKGGRDCQCDGPEQEYLWDTPCHDTFLGC